jgi:Domain of Unknown Function with PDB structure (DUF3857)/Transglutaminase-like superfamily
VRIYREVLPIALAVAAFSFVAGAQKFQEPTREELQMTSDPKAPGAPAVFLYREESTDNRGHYVSSYARIKVLTELGKEWATVQIPYVPGVSAPPIIEGRTIHADGTVIPLAGKGADLLAYRTNKAHVKETVFNLPSVEVGSILEYKWTIPLTGGQVSGVVSSEEGTVASELASSTPRWDVQREIFVHKEHFYFNPFSSMESTTGGNDFTYFMDGENVKYLLYTQNLPPGVQVAKSPKDDYSLDIQDVPAIQHASHAPPEAGLSYRVTFYRSPYLSADVYWENEVKRWSKRLDQFAGQTDALKQAADQITAGAATPDAKARKLYDAVQAVENTDFTRTKSAAERERLHLKKELKKAQDVWSEKSGSGNDLAALYLALARSAGLDAYGVQVADRSRRIFDPNLLSMDQFDSLLVVVRIDGKEIFLDPGEKLCPFGQLHWTHSLAGGLAEIAKAPIFTPANLSKDAITAHSADLKIDEQGAVGGTVKALLNGPEALRWRQLSLTADEDEVRKQFNESLRQILPQGVSGEVDHFEGLDSGAGSLSAAIKVSGPLGTVTEKRIVLPAFFFSASNTTQFVTEANRTVPVDMHYAQQVIDDVIYHLPTGFSVESAPQPAQMPWPEHAVLVTKTTSGPGVIDVKHIFARIFVLMDAKQYPELRAYYQKVAASDQQQLVLAHDSTPAGE